MNWTRSGRIVGVVAMMCGILGTQAQPAAADPPSAPILVDSYVDPGVMSVVWQAPVNNGGFAITSYVVELVGEGLSIEDSPAAFEIEPGFYLIWIYGLENAVEHTITVQARNADGLGLPLSFSATPPGCPGTPYFDVLPTNPFCAEIAWVTQNGIAQGTDTGTDIIYEPVKAVSRQAMAAFLHRFFGSPPPTLTSQFFADVGPSHPFYDDIQWMAETGLSTGTPQPGGLPLYKPASPVSRQAMAAFLHRASGDPTEPSTTPHFADVTASNPFFADIQWMFETGLSTGTPQPGGLPLYKPVSNVSRQAMAAFLFRFDQLLTTLGLDAAGDGVAEGRAPSVGAQPEHAAQQPVIIVGRDAADEPGFTRLAATASSGS